MICGAAMTTKPNNQCPANAERKSFGQVLFHCAASLFWAAAKAALAAGSVAALFGEMAK